MKNKRKFAATFLALIFLVGCIGETPVTSINSVSNAPPESISPSENFLSPENKSPANSSQISTDNGSTFSPSLEGDIAENLETFLNESQVLYWLEPVALDAIQEPSLEQASLLRVIISQVLMAYAEKNSIAVSVTEDGIPYFPISDFTCASAELFGLSCDFEQLAAISSDQAPEGMLCISWGYDLTPSRIVVDRTSLRSEQEQYHVQIEDYLPASAMLGNDSDILRTKNLTFYINQPYQFSPIQLISIIEQ